LVLLFCRHEKNTDLLTLFFCLWFCFCYWASIYHSIIAFDETGLPDGNRPGYVKPIITQLGTVLNSNWVHSANVPQSFSFDAGLPITLSPITDKDRNYTASNVPTIFGANIPGYNFNPIFNVVLTHCVMKLVVMKH
jgi:hypothetical protein